MKKLLATTAICLVFTTGFHGMASANEAVITVEYSAQDFAKTNNTQQLPLVESGMYRGDFQKKSRAIIGEKLYSGDGSTKMASIRSVRW